MCWKKIIIKKKTFKLSFLPSKSNKSANNKLLGSRQKLTGMTGLSIYKAVCHIISPVFGIFAWTEHCEVEDDGTNV